MKNVENIQHGDYIAFGYNYNGGKPNEIIVAPVTAKSEGTFLTHFSIGYKSLGEWVKKEDILAIGCKENGTEKIEGWSGRFILVKERKTIDEIQDRFLQKHKKNDRKTERRKVFTNN